MEGQATLAIQLGSLFTDAESGTGASRASARNDGEGDCGRPDLFHSAFR